MAFVVKDRVKVTTTTTGTSDFALGAAALGFQDFAIIDNGNQTYYAAVDNITGDWEVGIGTYTTAGPTLTRTTILESSAAGAKVSFAAGNKDVFVTYPAERAVYLDAAGSAVTVLDIGTLGASTANITTATISSGTVATTPVNSTDIVNKQYADAIAAGIHFHEAVALATTAALPANTYNNGTSGVGATLTANANGALSVDSTLTIATERILVKNEAAQANNGVYTVTQVGSAGTPYILTRATDFDTVGTGTNQIDEGDFFLVTSGTANVNTAWVQQTAPPITIGTTAIVFQQFAAPAGGGGLTYVYKTANYTAASNEGVLCDTVAGAFTVTLPATPAVGVQVIVADAGGAWGTNNLTVDRNGALIAGLAENLVCDIAGVSVQLVYDGTSWEVYAQIGVNSGTLVTLNDTQTLTNKDLTSATNTFPTSLATLVGTQTLTNKTIAFANNTLTGVQAELVSGSSIKTINGTTLLGSGDLAVAPGILTINNKTAAYTVVAGDLGKVINCTSGTFTVSLTAAATLGAGFNVTIWNSSATATDVIAIDASASETIDGLLTVILRRGEGMQIVSDGSNWQTGNKKVMRAYAENMFSTSPRPVASGNGAIAICSGGNTCTASNTGAINIGGGTSSGAYSVGILGSPSGSYSTAIGLNSSAQFALAPGTGAVSLGGSYASGTDAFAAVIGTTSSSYGTSNSLAIAMGFQARANYFGIAIGGRSFASASNSISICTSYVSQGNVSSGGNSITLGDGNAASGISSVAWGYGANARIYGKQVWAGGSFGNTNAEGSSQTGLIVLRGATTTATAAVMTSNNASASTDNQVILPNDSTFIFSGQLVARNTGSDTDSKVWEFKGGIRRGTFSSTTTLIGSPIIELIASDGSAWTVALTADTTNGGLAVTVTGEAAKTIRWVATVWTTEVTG